jgi:hypothetical protein
MRPVLAYALAAAVAVSYGGNVGLWQFTYALFSAATVGGTGRHARGVPSFLQGGRRRP